uniref:Uncharacterized protein n=1 Tax=Timema poppense TaxID=170557 RepID=A0A7R9DSZ8_TIMPO|nr:unnamed protein product [Timema poppensis]
MFVLVRNYLGPALLRLNEHDMNLLARQTGIARFVQLKGGSRFFTTFSYTIVELTKVNLLTRQTGGIARFVQLKGGSRFFTTFRSSYIQGIAWCNSGTARSMCVQDMSCCNSGMVHIRNGKVHVCAGYVVSFQDISGSYRLSSQTSGRPQPVAMPRHSISSTEEVISLDSDVPVRTGMEGGRACPKKPVDCKPGKFSEDTKQT